MNQTIKQQKALHRSNTLIMKDQKNRPPHKRECCLGGNELLPDPKLMTVILWALVAIVSAITFFGFVG